MNKSHKRIHATKLFGISVEEYAQQRYYEQGQIDADAGKPKNAGRLGAQPHSIAQQWYNKGYESISQTITTEDLHQALFLFWKSNKQ